jgi:hypothetical protein
LLFALPAIIVHFLAAPTFTLRALPLKTARPCAIVLANDGPAATPADDHSKLAVGGNPSSPHQPIFLSGDSFLPGQTILTRVGTAADEPDSLAASSTPGTSSSRAYGAAPVIQQRMPAAEARINTRTWMLLSAAEHGAATFDAWSTRRNITLGYVEMDPLMKPFANSNAMYAAVQVAPVLFDLLSRHMMVSSHGWERRMWWVPQSASTVASLAAGAHNVAIH